MFRSGIRVDDLGDGVSENESKDGMEVWEGVGLTARVTIEG